MSQCYFNGEKEKETAFSVKGNKVGKRREGTARNEYFVFS